MSESPIWLNAKGRKDECIQTLEKIVAILNGKLTSWEDYQKCNPNLLKEDNDIRKEKKGKNYTLLQIINFKSQRKNFLLMTYIWLACSYCYYGIILNF